MRVTSILAVILLSVSCVTPMFSRTVVSCDLVVMGFLAAQPETNDLVPMAAGNSAGVLFSIDPKTLKARALVFADHEQDLEMLEGKGIEMEGQCKMGEREVQFGEFNDTMERAPERKKV